MAIEAINGISCMPSHRSIFLPWGWQSDAIRCYQLQSEAYPHLEFGNGCDDATGRDAEDEVACGV